MEVLLVCIEPKNYNMTGRKQVMDMRSTTSGISQMESNDQQRNWSDEQWKNKAKDSLANYDPTRASLNFEVTKGGVCSLLISPKVLLKRWQKIWQHEVLRTRMQTQKP